MKRVFIYLLLGIILVGLLFFLRTLFHNFGTTSLDQVEIKDGLILDKSGAPFDGTLLGNVDHAESALEPMLDLVAFNSELRALPFSRDEVSKGITGMKEDLLGFSVHANVENGKLSDDATLYYDLRTPRSLVMGRTIDRNFLYYVGYIFNNQIEIAAANLRENKLNGDASVFGLDPKNWSGKQMELNFEDNVPTTIKRYHENGQLKRVNNYVMTLKDGLQQEYRKDGKLSYEVHYEEGKRGWEKAYYNSKDQLRKHVSYNDVNVRMEKQFFPDGTPSKEIVGRDIKEWFSNGEIKIYRQGDSTFYGKPAGRIETFHENGKIATVYNYDSSGNLEGDYERFYRSGQPWEKGTYRDGQRNGSLKKWYTNGQMAEDHIMKFGSIDGLYVRYYDDGTKWKEFNYSNGKLQGAYKKWWKNGTLAKDCNYANNLAQKCAQWNDEGVAIK